MYNDYYLQAINDKLASSNMSLVDINNQLQTSINNQATLISGDKEIISKINLLNNNILICDCLIGMFVLFLFVVRCLK